MIGNILVTIIMVILCGSFLTIFVCTRKEFPAFAYYMLLLTLIFGAIGFKILGV